MTNYRRAPICTTVRTVPTLEKIIDFLTMHFDAHCCHMGTTIKYLLPDRVKLSFVFFDIWTL